MKTKLKIWRQFCLEYYLKVSRKSDEDYYFPENVTQRKKMITRGDLILRNNRFSLKMQSIIRIDNRNICKFFSIFSLRIFKSIIVLLMYNNSTCTLSEIETQLGKNIRHSEIEPRPLEVNTDVQICKGHCVRILSIYITEKLSLKLWTSKNIKSVIPWDRKWQA